MTFKSATLRNGRLPRRFALIAAAGLLMLAAPIGHPAESPKKKPERAKASVRGYGLFGNLNLRKTLRLLVLEDTPPPSFSANFIEDAAIILRAKALDDGYLNARVTAYLTIEDGSTESHVWTEVDTPILPRSMRARDALFDIEKGILFHYENLDFVGLNSISEERARSLFIESGGLLPLKKYRVYTPDRLKQGLDNLVELLRRDGFENATANVDRLRRDDRTGTVAATVRVIEGKRSIVRSVEIKIPSQEFVETGEAPGVRTNAPYSSLWVQDFVQGVKQNYFRTGFPDAAVEVTPALRDETDDTTQIDLEATVTPGPLIKVGSITFEGRKKSRISMLRNQLSLTEGDLLDRILAERSRYRLARLGVFDQVDLTYAKRNDSTRDLQFHLKEGKTIDTSLLFGYGSYELLRAGVELQQFNVFGRAHSARLRAVQSFKSSAANYTYTMPQVFGHETDVFINASGLSRKEISFTRREFGGGIGARRYLDVIRSDASVRYGYEILSATDTGLALGETARDAGVASLITDIRHDRRDNPLLPRAGYKLFGNLELAAKYLGGEVNYQRFKLDASYHRPLGRSRWIHAGLSHGFIFSFSGTRDDLPFNRRFFPGGENSMRGFQQGEAAPRDEMGRIVGADTFATVNLELEQGLTPQWSVVGFFDAVGFARDIANYPFDETRAAVGGGLRWNTFIGPVRLEYGHNLNPSRHDPSGTLHFSIGFPF